MKSIYPIITREKQAAFEAQVGATQKNEIPCICGYCGRACRQMGDSANRAICFGCPLATFARDVQ